MKKKITIIILCFIVLTIIGIVLFYALNKKKQNTNSIEEKNETNIVKNVEESNTNYKYESVFNFLASEKYISTEDAVGAGYPEGYYFNSKGQFAYVIGDNNPTREGEILSCRGNWKIIDNKLVLYILEDQKAIGGKEVKGDDLQIAHIENYKKEVSTVNETTEYDIKDFIVDKENNNYYLKLDNYNLYQLSVGEEFLNQVKDIAINGYK